MPEFAVPLQPESWRSEFERQATPDVRERLYRAARARLRMYAGRTRHVNDADVDDVVMSALADTLDGGLSWDPGSQTLERHLLDAIAFRVRDQARFKNRHGHEPYEEDESGEPITSRVIDDIGDTYDLRVVADQVVSDIQVRVTDDPEVLMLMALFAEGVTDRADVIREAKMSPAEYDNAVRRLRRLTKQLPKQTRDAAMAALT